MRLILILLFLLAGCSTRSDLAGKFGVPKKVLIADVPFISQEDFECGPATLAMYMKYRGKDVTVKELVSQAFTKGKKGSFQSDMVTAVRRQAFIPLPLNDLKSLFLELNAANPVIIFQNLGLSWIPTWHYSLVIGYDLSSDEIILHSGEDASSRMKLRTFEKTWKRSENWGLVMVRPGKIPVTTNETDMVEATAAIEAMNMQKEAEASYKSIYAKWPGSLGALVGMGNIYYNRKNYPRSARVLKEATLRHPTSAIAWHNYAWALKANNKHESARSAANYALSLPQDELLSSQRENLHQILDASVPNNGE